MRPASVTAILLLVAAPTAAASAQVRTHLGLGFGMAATWEESAGPGGVIARSGLTAEGGAELGLSLFEIAVLYRQGSLRTPDGSDERDLVEGQAMLGVVVAPWLKLDAGPRLRAYTTAAGTERWIFWEGRAQAGARVLRPFGLVFLRVGWVFGADLTHTTLDYGRGAEAGVELRLGRTPLLARLGYGLHHASTGGGQRVETLQGLAITLLLTGERLRK